jgi:CheY-like chemotaxis protein
VSLYSSGFNDIHQIVELAPDLVILDLLIGGESQGWQMLQKMKMSRETATIPVVVCTAAVSLARDLEGHLRSKNVGLVLKPFDIDELVDEVRKYLNPASAPMPEVS